MKKVLAIVAALMLIPFTAYGMQSISEQEMSEVSGQSGVAITIDDVVIHESGIEETWYQNDITGNGNTAAVGMIDPDNRESMMFVNAITADPTGNAADASPGQYGLYGDYSELNTLHNNVTEEDLDFHSSPLTIQVANVAEYDEFMNTANSTDITWSAFSAAGKTATNAVIIGLPTVEIYNEGTDAMQLLISESGNPIGDTRADDGVASFGTLYSGGGSSMAILDGRVEIAPVEGVQ